MTRTARTDDAIDPAMLIDASKFTADELVNDPEKLRLAAERARIECNRNCRYQVDALLAAGWRFELPDSLDPDPWSWYWRRQPRRKNSQGMFFWSTNQAYNALMRGK